METFMGMTVIENPDMPKDEIRLVQPNGRVDRITNIGTKPMAEIGFEIFELLDPKNVHVSEAGGSIAIEIAREFRRRAEQRHGGVLRPNCQ